MKARLEEKSAQINRLENARDEAAEGYRTPQRYTEQHQESESEDGSDKSETRAAAAAATRFYKNYNFDDESGVNPHDQATMDYLTALARQVEAKQKSRKGKRAVNLYKKQGATPSTHRTPVSGGPRKRDQVEPTGDNKVSKFCPDTIKALSIGVPACEKSRVADLDQHSFDTGYWC